MRVTLNQDELFEAISSHLKDKLNLDATASIEISFTAGRSPKGYTADVDITYPQSATAAKFTAKNHDDVIEVVEIVTIVDRDNDGSPEAVPDPTAGGAVPSNLFDN